MWEIAVHLAVAGDVYDGFFLCCPFSTKCLVEILDLIGSVFEGFPTYCFICESVSEGCPTYSFLCSFQRHEFGHSCPLVLPYM